MWPTWVATRATFTASKWLRTAHLPSQFPPTNKFSSLIFAVPRLSPRLTPPTILKCTMSPSPPNKDKFTQIKADPKIWIATVWVDLWTVLLRLGTQTGPFQSGIFTCASALPSKRRTLSRCVEWVTAWMATLWRRQATTTKCTFLIQSTWRQSRWSRLSSTKTKSCPSSGTPICPTYSPPPPTRLPEFGIPRIHASDFYTIALILKIMLKFNKQTF